MSDADDMDKIYSTILQRSPNTKVHSWEKIEGVHDKGVFELGEIIAQECKVLIERWKAANKLDKISFLGFSFGGLIFRAAFEHLKQYKDHFYSFITLASPHFGWIYSESKLFSMGIWAFSKVSSSPIVQQLRLGDSDNYKETALYKLSEKEGLNWFENILLWGSYQDNYSPLESSLMQYSNRLKQTKNYESIKEMCRNLHTMMKKVHVYKTCVNLKISEQSIDTYIGRKAHIQYLENSDLIKCIVHKYSDIFITFKYLS